MTARLSDRQMRYLATGPHKIDGSIVQRMAEELLAARALLREARGHMDHHPWKCAMACSCGLKGLESRIAAALNEETNDGN